MRFIKVIFGALLTILGIIFIINNLEILRQQVQFKFDIYLHTFHSAPISLWVLILFIFFLGVLTAALYGIFEVLQQRRTIRQLRHNLEILSSEMENLPGRESHPAPEAVTAAADPQ